MAIKLKQPEVIEATYRIVTPMFIGDADQKATGISPASVKGALRFWWRALNWGRIQRTNETINNALKQLHEEEGLLFGSSAYDDKNKQRKKEGLPEIGKSIFNLEVKSLGLKTKNKFNNLEEGIKYLLGQGLYDFRKGVLRDVISSGEILIRLILKSDVTDKQRKQLEETLLIFGLLGGLGSRSRKGFGSLSIKALKSENFSIPLTLEEYISLLQGLTKADGEPPFSAFSKDTKIHISLKNKKPIELLNKVGMEQQLYRSWGRNINGIHKVGVKDAEQNFPQSHDLMEGVARGSTPNTMPDKAVFGLPQNYFFSSMAPKVNVEFSLKEKDRSRRASPLFIHVHQLPDGKTFLTHTLLKACFLTENDTLEFKTGRYRYSLNYRPDMIDWGIINTYLERFADREEIV